MKGSLFMKLQRAASLVRKYQVRWEFCLDSKTTRTIGPEYLPIETKRVVCCANERAIHL
jgi:hypothetical protein